MINLIMKPRIIYSSVGSKKNSNKSVKHEAENRLFIGEVRKIQTNQLNMKPRIVCSSVNSKTNSIK